MSQETRARKKYATTRTSRLPAEPTGMTAAQGLPEAVSDQERRRAILAGLIARAQVLVPDPPDSPTRKACRELPVDEVIAEKFRRQGFKL